MKYSLFSFAAFLMFAIASPTMAQSNEAEVASLEGRIAVTCSNNIACINSSYQILGTRIIPQLHRENLSLVAESKRLAGPEAAIFDESMTRQAINVLNYQMERLEKDGLTSSVKREILNRLLMAKRDNSRLRAFVLSLKK